MASTIQVRVDDDLKSKSDALFRDLGTDTTSAIRIFLTQAVANNGFPFEIKRNSTEYNPFVPMTEEELLSKLEISRKHASQGKYRDADDVVANLRGKYGI
ncbi:type II toxin-antitoxin system RelB/DinJ family antitoxin [Anaerosporobacter sp.]|uniref:type II toxin-antitoxin system RelB/DinJ family antitoxin n=1 Tax=Anaerosporobacter sp. TaxID=1872529 RepID=UPI00286EDE9B|nr:type II toxin-antitoxin system RelB/DinJ family antitoxin [Anaerosporobacter sp.]